MKFKESIKNSIAKTAKDFNMSEDEVVRYCLSAIYKIIGWSSLFLLAIVLIVG